MPKKIPYDNEVEANTIKKHLEIDMYPLYWTPSKEGIWIWYNKVDTKLREFSERGLLYGKKKL